MNTTPPTKMCIRDSIQGTGAAAGSRTVTVMWVVIALLVLAGAIAYNAMQ